VQAFLLGSLLLHQWLRCKSTKTVSYASTSTQDSLNHLLALKFQTPVCQLMTNILYLLPLVLMEITNTQPQLRVLLLPKKVTQLLEKTILK